MTVLLRLIVMVIKSRTNSIAVNLKIWQLYWTVRCRVVEIATIPQGVEYK